MKKVVQQKVSSDGSEKATEGLIHNQNSMRERQLAKVFPLAPHFSRFARSHEWLMNQPVRDLRELKRLLVVHRQSRSSRLNHSKNEQNEFGAGSQSDYQYLSLRQLKPLEVKTRQLHKKMIFGE